MATGNESSSFAINLDGNVSDVARDAADSVENLKEKIQGGIASIRDMNSAMRNLKGTSAEVKKAKEELKARVQSEQAAISKATLEQIKSEKVLSKVGKTAKQVADERKKIEAALSESVKKNEDEKKKAVARSAAAMKESFAKSLEQRKKLDQAFLSSIAVIAAFSAAVIGSVASLGKFIIQSADAARSVNILREASMRGNAQWGKNFGEQVEALGRKVPTSRDEIDALGKSLAANNIGGQTWVDTLNAVTQASAALGDTAGNKLKEFVERGKVFQRFQLNPQEMIGSGVTFKEVAEQLAGSMKISIKAAQQALFEGRVKLADGAAALRVAVEKNFSKINLRQMLSLETLAKKLGESFDDLVKGVNIEPILVGLKEFFDIFSLTTESGQAIKQLVSVFGNDMVGAMTSTIPFAKKLVYGLIIGAQNVAIGYLTVRNAIRKTFGGDSLKGIVSMQSAVTIGKVAVYALVGAVAALGVALAVAAVPLAFIAAPFVIWAASIKLAVDSIREIVNTDWIALGNRVTDGLVKGIRDRIDSAKKAVGDLASSIKQAFADKLQIRSPSRVFAEYGKHTAKGFELGVESGSEGAQSAVNDMAGKPSGGRSGRSNGGSSPVVVNVSLNVTGSNGKDIAAQLTSDSTIESLTKILIDALRGAGIQVPS